MGDYVFCVVFLMFIVACSEDNIPEHRDIDSISKYDVIDDYTRNAFYTYKDALVYGRVFQSQVLKFIEKPDVISFAKTKKAWLDSRAIFSRSEMFSSHYELLNKYPGLFAGINGMISYDIIDYTKDDNTSGVINSPERYSSIADFTEITRDNLISLNRHDSERGLVVTGYHAIEFLLWGEDFNSNLSKENGMFDRSMVGSRPVSDYITHKNAKRRAQYLQVISALLIDGLSYITKEWDPNRAEGYDAYFKGQDIDKVLSDIYYNILSNVNYVVFRDRFLSVVRGGMEHSPFSDNSLSEISDNIHRLQFVYTGHYVDGSSRYHGRRGFRGYALCYIGDEKSKEIDESYKYLIEDLSLYIDGGNYLDASYSLEEMEQIKAGWLRDIISGIYRLDASLKAIAAREREESPHMVVEEKASLIAFEEEFSSQIQPEARIYEGFLYPPPASLDYYPTPQSAYSGSYSSGSYGSASQRAGFYGLGSYASGLYEGTGKSSSGEGAYVPVYRPVIIKSSYYGC